MDSAIARGSRSSCERLARRIHLFYANRRPEAAAFLAELQETAMTMAMKRLLETMGAGAQDMRHEEFYGY